MEKNCTDQNIINDYLAGCGTKALAIKYHKAVRTISTILKNNNIQIKSPGGQIKIKSPQEIIDLYLSGDSTCAIAKVYNVDASTILRILNDNGIDTGRGRRRKTDAETTTKIITDYESGMTMTEVGKKYNLNPVSIMNILDRNGIVKRTHGGIYKLPEDDVVQEYLNGDSTGKIAQKYGVTTKCICDLFRKLGVERNNRQGSPNLKVDFWENIDTPEKAYFLGWMLTDGNVYKNQVRLSLQSADAYILEVFRKYVQSDALVTHYKRKSATISWVSNFTVYCKRWVNDLAKWTIVPNKTFTCKLPTLPDNLMPHLIRGCIDGDGYISKSGKTVGFCGNLQMAQSLHDYVMEKLNLSRHKIIRVKNIWDVAWSSRNDVNKLGNYLYGDKGDLYLTRKFERWISNPNNHLHHADTEVIHETHGHRNA